MKPVPFSTMNCNYTAPGCEDLPARQEEVNGHLEVVSVWQPSQEELNILNAGGMICLSVIGGQPPVSIWAEKVQLQDHS